MQTETFAISTHGRRVSDITEQVAAFAEACGGSGLLHVFLPHATAGLALLETGSGSEEDLEDLLTGLVPRDDRYRHRHGSVGHGGDHLLPALVSPSLTIPVEDGRLLTSAGISAGIDMALKAVARCCGETVARATAKHMEYPYPDANARRVTI